MDIITGDLEFTLEDGTRLTARTDIGLASQWAEHQTGADAWAALSFHERNLHIAATLDALRKAWATAQ